MKYKKIGFFIISFFLFVLFSVGYSKQEQKGSSNVIDLTKMSKIMVYSSLFNIVSDYKNYVGKEIILSGNFTRYCDEETNKVYYVCLIQDATACCMTGINFVPDKKYLYPEDFPKENAKITIRGTLETFEEDGNTFCQLTNTVMEFKK
ncbi:MAG: hypothetical protein K5622_05205 [Endomicrobiaceae bacterium]|nr:hypothetical protein [Endomicrobiaceae bacterium]